MKHEIRPTHILWSTGNRNHWAIAAKGDLQDCRIAFEELNGDGDQYEIHENEIKTSWNNSVEGTHFDQYMDDSVESRPMTAEEIESEKY